MMVKGSQGRCTERDATKVTPEVTQSQTLNGEGQIPSPVPEPPPNLASAAVLRNGNQKWASCRAVTTPHLEDHLEVNVLASLRHPLFVVHSSKDLSINQLIISEV